MKPVAASRAINVRGLGDKVPRRWTKAGLIAFFNYPLGIIVGINRGFRGRSTAKERDTGIPRDAQIFRSLFSMPLFLYTLY